MADDPDREAQIDQMIAKDRLYDCRHLQMQFSQEVLPAVRLVAEKPYIERGEVPPGTYYCAKLDMPCVFMGESAVMILQGKETGFPIAHLNNLEKLMLCDVREDSEYAAIDHTVSRMRFLSQRLIHLLIDS